MWDERDVIPARRGEEQFALVRTKPEDIRRIRELEQAGFTFHNRMLTMEVNLQKWDQGLERCIRYECRYLEEVSQDMYGLACLAFVRDRRFHLKREFDQTFAEPSILGYLEELASEPCMVFHCLYKGTLVGFTVIKKRENLVCENCLGAVLPEWQSKGAAMGLYVYMARELRTRGIKRLRGEISSTNLPSLNLHVGLGGRFVEECDVYIRRMD